ncbi:MAG: histidinol dehydrogenase, partial [Oscillospiraceae bacterium]|nr:histidinol dehydrogenase [Oscillospiraceae bacterium]
MLQIVTANGAAEQNVLAAIRNRAAEAGAKIQATVLEMMERVRQEGFAAVEAYSLQLDGAKPREITQAEWDAAVSRCPKD